MCAEFWCVDSTGGDKCFVCCNSKPEGTVSACFAPSMRLGGTGGLGRGGGHGEGGFMV